jgi:hypothetical protein
MAMSEDLGTQVVRRIHTLWNVDEEWTLWDTRGFSWWAQDYCQRLWAEPAIEDDGFSIYKLCTQTDFIRDLDVKSPHFYEKLSLLGKFASTSAAVLDATQRTLRLWSIMYLHQETAESVTKFFSGVAILQPIEAQIRAAEFSRTLLGGRADTSAHPTSGPRRDGDEMLRVVEDIYAPAGQERSCWSGSEEFEQVAGVLNQGNCFATPDADGLTAEFSFGKDETSLLTVRTHERHPQLGHGMLLRLHLPQLFVKDNAPFTAALLNTLETRHFTRAHLVGSWCAAQMGEGVPVPVFVGFIPNALYVRGLLLNLVAAMAMQARWTASEIQGPSTESNVVSILGNRLRQLFSWGRRA